MGGTRFMVQWEEHPSHLATRLGQLLEHQTLVDVTLMCNTHTLRVHRAVLAACSPYFETILQRQLGMHPLIVLKDMQFSVLKSLIEFMYCGETSVTEDNLGALLQAAKFFQVKGLSAMTKEALGLVPNTKTAAVNGDTGARKAFVGRPKRVGIQQTYVTTGGMKTVASTSNTISGEATTVPAKATFQTIAKPVSVATTRPDTQQQTESAQLLLSLSGSEVPRQTFHTVSKNVRFHHNVSSAGTTEPTKTLTVDAGVKKEGNADRVTLLSGNAGLKSGTTVAVTPTEDNTVVVSAQQQQQTMYITEPPRKRGRPVKRQMNVVFKEKVMTDADMALQKEAEASRKALEMLRQEMQSDTGVSTTADSNTVVSTIPATSVTTLVPGSTAITQITASPSEIVRKVPMSRQGILPATTKIHTIVSQSPVTTMVSQSTINSNNNIVIPKKLHSNIVYKSGGNTIVEQKRPSIEQRIVTQSSTVTPTMSNAGKAADPIPVPIPTADQAESILPDQMEMSTGQVLQLAAEDGEATATTQESEDRQENLVEYQVTEEGDADAVDGTNIVYQVADTAGGAAGSVMSQYMEVLKEAGLPTDVPILLDSGDGSYVTVNEEVLMNIVNGGVLQCHVTDGNIVSGEGIEFVVQEMSEAEVDAAHAAAAAAQQEVSTPSTETAETPMEVQSAETDAQEVLAAADTTTAEESMERSGEEELQEQQVLSETVVDESECKYLPMPTLDDDSSIHNAVIENTETITEEEEPHDTGEPVEGKHLLEEDVGEFYAPEVEDTMDITGDESVNTAEEDTQDGGTRTEERRHEEVITGDRYGESAMEGFAALRRESSSNEASLENFDDSKQATSPVMKPEDSLGTTSTSFNDETTAGSFDDAKEKTSAFAAAHRNIQSAFMFHEESTSCEDTQAGAVKEDEKKDEEQTNDKPDKKEDPVVLTKTKVNSVKSVEEALQEMMGDSSDTELDICDGNTATSATSQDDGDSQPPPLEQRSPEQEAEELRLVLGPEEDRIRSKEKRVIEEDHNSVHEVSSVHDDSLGADLSEDREENELEIVQHETSSEELHIAEDKDEIFVQETEMDGGNLILTSTAGESLPGDTSKEGAVLQNAPMLSESIESANRPVVDEIRESLVPSPVVEPSEDLSRHSTSTEELVVNVSAESDKSSQELVLNLPQEDVVPEVEDEDSQLIVHSEDSQSVEPVEVREGIVSGEEYPNQDDGVGNEGEMLESALEESEGTEGVTVSPTKDIPYAVGLLPLKTALQKLQEMPDHTARKTRSSSTGRDSGPSSPGVPTKRKAVSNDEPEKRQKTSDTEENVIDEHQDEDMEVNEVVPPIAEDASKELEEEESEIVTVDSAEENSIEWLPCNQQKMEEEGMKEEETRVEVKEDQTNQPSSAIHSMPELIAETTEG